MADPNPKIVIRAKDETKRAFKSARFSLGKLKDSVFNLNSALAGLVGAAGFGAVISKTIEAQDQIGKLSQRLGASTEALSQYKFVAEKSGVTFQTLTMGWQRMTRRVSEAAQGMGEARGALAELNLDATRLSELKPEQQFEILADAIMKVKSPADQVRLAMKLFDSEGVSLIQTMQGGAEAMRETREEADALGLTLSEEQTAAAADANDAMTELKASFSGLANVLTGELAEPLAGFVRAMSDAVPVATNLAKKAVENLGITFTALWETFNPSDITGPKGFFEAMTDAKTQLKETAAEAKAAKDALSETKEVLTAEDLQPDTLTIAKPLRISALDAALADFESFEDAKTRIVRTGERDRSTFMKMSTTSQTKHILGETIKMTQGVTGESRKLFELNKAAAISSSLINTYEGVTRAIQKYPPPLSFAMAALQLAAGLAQVQAIRGTSFGSGGGGSPSLAGSGAAADTVNTIPIAPPAEDTPQQPNVTVIFQGSGIGDDHLTEVVTQAVNHAWELDILRQ
jgi:hypothetical protein